MDQCMKHKKTQSKKFQMQVLVLKRYIFYIKNPVFKNS